MEQAKKKDLVVLDKELHIQKLKTNMAMARKDILSMTYSIEEYKDNLKQWEKEILKQEEELIQVKGG